MPIRIEKDEEQTQPGGDRGKQRERKGGSGLGGLLPMILPLLLKNPKLLIVVIIGFGAMYFFKRGCNPADIPTQQSAAFGKGCEMKQEVYDKAEVFAALSDKEKLPEQVSLERFAPTRQNQGSQGSCVGWGSAYAARTIMQSASTGVDPDQTAFSPAFTYNQIGLSGCQGSYIVKAMESLSQVGAVPISEFPYREESCSEKPEPFHLQEASKFRMRGYNRLSLDGDNYAVDILAMKQNLAKGGPVVIGMAVGGSFMQEMMGQKVWHPTEADYSKQGFGGHCMCVIGYDDYLEGGAFQIMNSWGKEWGENGIAWVRYSDFEYFAMEAYGLDPLAKQGTETLLKGSVGLISKDGSAFFPFKLVDGNLFSTITPMPIGTRFKVEVSNSIECYTYVLGQDTDQSSYVLFPYTDKHSAYCGITGTRIFPRDYSLVADNIGNRDYMAIIVSKQQLDIKDLNAKINQSQAGGYRERVNRVLGSLLADNRRFSTGETINFDLDTKNKTAIALVFEIEKR